MYLTSNVLKNLKQILQEIFGNEITNQVLKTNSCFFRNQNFFLTFLKIVQGSAKQVLNLRYNFIVTMLLSVSIHYRRI
jgi:hypothetical protein